MLAVRRAATFIPNAVRVAPLSTSGVMCKHSERKEYLRSMPKRDEGIQSYDFGNNTHQKFEEIVEFPSVETEHTQFNGITYADLPILHIRVSKNNTKLICLQADNATEIMKRSCGMDGFKNCRKGSNVAAQTTSLNMGKKLLLKGIRNVKVGIKGLGPGRMSSIQGLVLSGINIVSISDLTDYSKYPKHRPCLPKSL